MNISELKLSARSYNLLHRKGIDEIEALLSMSDDEIIDLYGGRVAMGEVLEAIKPLRKSKEAWHMKIEIESRQSIEERANRPFPAHTALISIADTDAEFAVLKNKPEYLLQMKFDDVSDEIFEELLGRQPTEDEAVLLEKRFHMFSSELAEETAAFVVSVLGKAETLICQCEYGQSRSAGCAATVSEYLYKNGISIFSDPRYYPNKMVFHKLFLALEKRGKEGFIHGFDRQKSL